MKAKNDEQILDCGHHPSPHSEITTGIAHSRDGKEICWDCAAKVDQKTMIEEGHSKNLPLYLSGQKKYPGSDFKVTNWPGTLSFNVYALTTGRHNIAGKRYDVWFNGPDGFVWHGVQYGEWTQIVHCKRTKEKAEEKKEND